MLRKEVAAMYNFGYIPNAGWQNPYQQRYENQINQQRVEITQVSGEDGARAYQLPPNSSILLMDNSAPIVWCKVTDGGGFPTIKGFDLSPHKSDNAINVSGLESRVARLEEVIANAAKPNNADVKRGKSGTAAAD